MQFDRNQDRKTNGEYDGMNEEQSKQLLEILKPYLDMHDEVRIIKEGSEMFIYGIDYKEICDFKGGCK